MTSSRSARKPETSTRRPGSQLLCAGLLLLVGWGSAPRRAAGEELYKNSLLFYASFDEGLTPDVHDNRYAPDTRFRKYYSLVNKVDGPTLANGKQGKALRIVSGKSGVIYPLPGHIRSDRGTIAFWVSAENWDSKETDVLQMPFSTHGTNNGTRTRNNRRIQIQHTYNSRSLDFKLLWGGRYQMASGGIRSFSSCSMPWITDESLVEGIERMKPGVWFHIAYAWGDGEVAAYRNGVCVGRDAYPKEKGDWELSTEELGFLFAIGHPEMRHGFRLRYICKPKDLGKSYYPKRNPDYEEMRKKKRITLIDEFAIFDRKLDKAQVAALHTGGVRAFMATADKNEARLEVFPLPTQRRVVFEAMHGEVPEGAQALVRIRSKEGEAEKVIPLSLDGREAQGEIQTDGLAPGLYEAEYKVVDRQRKALARTPQPVAFELAPQEEWWDNTIGEDDRLHDLVPPPWTPMGKDGDRISCWGRTIRYDGGALPRQIVSKGKDLLASPMALAFELDGQAISFPDPAVEYPLVSEAAVERAWTAKAEGVVLTVRSRTEFDGFIWTTLQVKNESAKPITGLKLNIPCVQEHAQFIHTSGRGWRGKTPPDCTTRKEWASAYGHFANYVWLGGYERGLQWISEGREGWFNRDKADELRVKPEGKRVTLTVKMISAPCDRKAFTIAFGLHPTPIKAPVARSKRRGTTGCWAVVPTLPRPSVKSGQSEQKFWAPDRQRREKNPNYFRYSFINSVASYYWKGEEIRERRWYKSEWECVPQYERLQPLSWSYFKTCADTSYADWWVWFIKNRWLHPDYGNMAGIYFDHGHPLKCGNPLHEGKCGYLDEDDILRPERKVVAMRNLLKRIYMAVKGIDKEHPQGATPDHPVVLHTSTEIIAPLVSFAYVFDGETFYTNKGHFMDRLSLSFMASEWSHTAWGYDERGTCFKYAYFMKGCPYQIDRNKAKVKGRSCTLDKNDELWMLRNRGVKPEKYDEMIGWLVPRERECNAMFLLFDRTPGFPSHYLKYKDNHVKWKRTVETFGFYEDDVEFRGFWKTGQTVSNQDEKLKASVYLRKAQGKALLAITNLRDDAVEREMVLDPAALGLDGALAITNGETGDAIACADAEDGTIGMSIRVPGRDYVLVLAQTKTEP